MRLTATMFALLMALPAFADDGAQTKRIAVVVSLSRPTERLPAAPQMQQQAASLVEALSTKGGYADVRALIGPVASAETVMSTVRAAVKDAGPQGVILFAFSGYGVGGDFGEPVLLTQGASVARPSETGLDVNQLAEVLGPHGNGQQILVLIDAMHTGNVDGVALIGPTASEWPRSSASGLTVITPRMGAAGTAQAGLLPALTQAISVRADSNGDGQLSMAELFRAMGPALSDESGSLVDTAGDLSSKRSIALLAAENPMPAFGVPGLSTALVLAGGVAGGVSLAMYTTKRGECLNQAGTLLCGDGAEYQRYQRTQHALGVVGGGLVAAGVGLRLAAGPHGISLRLSADF